MYLFVYYFSSFFLAWCYSISFCMLTMWSKRLFQLLSFTINHPLLQSRSLSITVSEINYVLVLVSMSLLLKRYLAINDWGIIIICKSFYHFRLDYFVNQHHNSYYLISNSFCSIKVAFALYLCVFYCNSDILSTLHKTSKSIRIFSNLSNLYFDARKDGILSFTSK